jgi:cytochrome P450 PksS
MSQSLNAQKDYDLLAPEALINPYPLYEQIRTEEPVYYFEKGGFWLITRYQDVEAAFLDSRLSSHRDIVFINQLHGLDLKYIQNFTKLASKFIVDKDPPDHTNVKKLLLPEFTSKALESWRIDIQSIVDNLLDQVESQQTIDVINDISLKLPSLVITKILGIPETETYNTVQYVGNIANLWGFSGSGDIKEIAEKAEKSALNITNLVNELIAERQQHPGNDMISFLIASCRQNGFDLEILPSLCVEIIAAGNVTTADGIPNGIYALINHQQQLQLLQENPQLINSAIEEIIRFDSPGQMVFRTAKENLSIGNKEIPTGSIVALGVASANRDPEKFPNPDVFDITRSPNEHLGFGKGNHFCLGAVLARMELKACFSTLLKRMPNLMLDPDKVPVVKRNTLAFKGFESLHAKF